MSKFENRIRDLFLIILFLLSLSAVGQQNASRKMIVVIDPGHGGTAYGAKGIDGVKEKDIVLSIAKEIARLNQTIYEDRFDIYLTRYSDTLISLSERTRLTRILKADMFISLHCNQSINRNGKGVEVYIANKKGPFFKQSVYLAYKIETALANDIGFISRGVKFANFQVLRELTSLCPAVLVEFVFLSNPDEAKYISKKKSKSLIALSLLQALKGYRL